MKTVIIVSKCLRVIKLNQSENTYVFHFRGVCAGEALRKVVLRGSKDFEIKKHEEYLMFVQMEKFESGILVGRILKCRPLDDCWDRS